MTSDLEVDADDLRGAAADLTRTGVLVAGDAADPPTRVRAPGWAVADTADAFESAGVEVLTAIGTAISHAATLLGATADAYDAADARAAARLRRIS